MFDAQRRYTAKSSRKKVLDDIQRHCAEQVYYVYTPFPKNLASWNPRVRNYAPKKSLRGLLVTLSRRVREAERALSSWGVR